MGYYPNGVETESKHEWALAPKSIKCCNCMKFIDAGSRCAFLGEGSYFGCEACAVKYGGFKETGTKNPSYAAWYPILDPNCLAPEYTIMPWGNKNNWKPLPSCDKAVKCNVNSTTTVDNPAGVTCGHSVIPEGELAYYYGLDDNDQAVWWCFNCAVKLKIVMPDGMEDLTEKHKDFDVPIALTSFSYKAGGVPDLTQGKSKLFDIRKTVRNPWQMENLRVLTGKSKEVQDFILACPRSKAVVDQISTFAQVGYENIFIGCFGGKHRSVAIAELVAAELKSKGYTNISIQHRDLKGE